jgi:hypothetical protein
VLLVLPRAIVGLVHVEIAAAPNTGESVSTASPARVTAHALVSACSRVGSEPLRLSVHRRVAIGRSVGPGASQRHFLALGWVTIPPPVGAPSSVAVRHHPAAGWVTTKPTLKLFAGTSFQGRELIVDEAEQRRHQRVIAHSDAHDDLVVPELGKL